MDTPSAVLSVVIVLVTALWAVEMARRSFQRGGEQGEYQKLKERSVK